MTLNALRRLADEARQAAARVPLGVPDHDFYAGVASAAEHHLHAGRLAVEDPAWLERQPVAFRDGYLEAMSIIAAAARSSLFHLPLPTH